MTSLPSCRAHRAVGLALVALAPLGLAGCGGGGGSFGSSSASQTTFNPFTAVNYVFKSQFGNTGAGALHGPYGLARDSSGNFYAVDFPNATGGRVVKFDKNGNFLLSFGTTGTATTGLLAAPQMVAVDGAGNVYVTDGQTSNGTTARVVKYDPSGNFLAQFGTTGTAATGLLSFPIGVAVDGSGNIYVTDGDVGSTQRVVKYDSSGNFLAQFGTTGTGTLAGPEGIALDSTGNLYVADYSNGVAGAVSRVVKYDSSGNYLAQFGATGTTATGLLASPQGVIVDPLGNVYVSDDTNDDVVKYSAGGTFLSLFDTKTTPSTQVSDPLGLALDSAGVLYVADGNLNSITVLQPEPGAAPAARPEASVPHAHVGPHHGRA